MPGAGDRGCWLYCPVCGRDYEVTWVEWRHACQLMDMLPWALADVRRQADRSPRVMAVTVTGRPSAQGYAVTWRWNARTGELEIWIARRRGDLWGRYWPVGLVLWEVAAPDG